MKLYSKILGEGAPLVILHGLFGMSDNWQTLGRKWAEDFEVHLLDMRNHGRSPHSPEFNYEEMSDDVLEYLDTHGLPSAHIIGHSMGGKIAMLFAVLHEDRVDKLVIADIAPKLYPPHHQDIIAALKNLDLTSMTNRKEAEEAFQITDPGTRQFLLKNLYWKEKSVLDWRFNLNIIADQINEVGERLPAQAMYHGPTIFVRGGKSGYITDEDMYEIEAHFPQAQLLTIDGAGHWLHAEKPQEFFDEVSGFLKGLSKE